MTKEEKKIAEELSNSSNIIGKGTTFQGDIETHGNIRVEGVIKGSIITKSKIVVGQSARVEGSILAQNAEVAGSVKGSVEVTELLTLRPTAVIDGDIITNKLVVESGSKFNGGCKMGAEGKEISLGQFAQNEKSKETESTKETAAV